jgi:ribosomal protein L14E/L6E/L27E
MTVGTVVYSKCGRDKGLPFVVMESVGEYVYLADGRLRPICKPKKKKLKHVQPTGTVVDLAAVGKRGLQDADIRKMLLLSDEREV